jgi:hypothetical protein
MLVTQKLGMPFLAGVIIWALLGAAPLPATLVVDPSGIIPVLINGSAVKMHMVAHGVSYPVLNPDAAERLTLKGGFFAAQAQIGPVKIPGKYAKVKTTISGVETKSRLLWFEKPVVSDADGMLGPESVPQTRVTFMLRAPAPNETSYSLPLITQNALVGSSIQAGGKTIFVQWHLQRARSLVTAAAANDLATSHGARLEGAAVPEDIAFTVKRPIRPLVLAQPLMVGPLKIKTLYARISDYGSVANVPDDQKDDSEIIVTAQSKTSRAKRSLIVGLSDLQSCSSLTFDKSARQVILSCVAS